MIACYAFDLVFFRFIRVELSYVKEVLFAAFWAFWVDIVRSRIFQFLFLLVEKFGGTYRVRPEELSFNSNTSAGGKRIWTL
jgi:hypothetical protein